MIEVSILIPVADNAGVKFDAALDVELHTFLLGEFGGYTAWPGLASGGWISAGLFYPDQHRVYSISLANITEGGKVRTLADEVKRLYA